MKLPHGQETAKQCFSLKHKDTTLSVDNQLIRGKKYVNLSTNFAVSGDVFVHTLGQLGHTHPPTALKKRAKNTFFSKELARLLTALDSPLNKAYRRTLFDCCSTMVQEGQKITSKYCDSRWCNTCNRIRTAKLINGYSKPLSEFKQAYFVTLSIPNVNKGDLRQSMAGMVKCFANIVKSKRRLKKAFNGIRKLECTYNSELDNYHPHFHVIVDGLENAQYLLDEWMKRNPNSDIKGQDYRECNGNYIELFKYTTKIVTKIQGEGFMIYIPALDTIFNSMKGMRTFQSFGNIRIVSENIDDIKSDLYNIEPYDFVVWVWEKSDWVSMIDGKPLTGYIPDKRMNELLIDRVIT